MADQYLPYPLPPCPEEPAEPAPQPCPGWDICLPWNGRIYSRNGCVYAERGNPPPDGVYGKIVIANGCIIDALPEDVPLYTGSPCAPLPGDCGGGGSAGVGGGSSGGTTGGSSGNTGNTGNTGTGSGSGGGSVSCCQPSSATGNLYELDAAGRPLVRCHIEAGTAISVTGDGSSLNPYVISANSGGGGGSGGGISTQTVYIRSGNAAISVTGAGTRTDPFTITHKTGASGSVDGITFDQFGHCTSISTSNSDDSISKYITGVVGTGNIDVTTDQKSKIVTVGLRKPANSVVGSYDFGDYKVEVDSYGVISSVKKKEQETQQPSTTTIIQQNASVVYMAFEEIGTSNANVIHGNFIWPKTGFLLGHVYMHFNSYSTSSLTVRIDGIKCDTGWSGTMEEPGLMTFFLKATLEAGTHEIQIGNSARLWPGGGGLLEMYPALYGGDLTKAGS